MTMHITACEVRTPREDGTNEIVYCVWRDGPDEDVKSANVLNEYVHTLCDANENNDGVNVARFVSREPNAETERAFFDVLVTVTKTHRKTSCFKVGYKRLDFASRYNDACNSQMVEIYGTIKSHFRQGLIAHRDEKAAKHDTRTKQEVAK